MKAADRTLNYRVEVDKTCVCGINRVVMSHKIRISKIFFDSELSYNFSIIILNRDFFSLLQMALAQKVNKRI